MALPVKEVSGFSVQVSVVCFFSLTPDTLRLDAWKPGTRPQSGVSEGPI